MKSQMPDQMKNENLKSPTSAMDTRHEENRENLRDQAGDLIEKAGHKLSENGAPKLGQKIHDMGDKLEKKHDNPSHPHKV